jgi:hypothetical protein
MPVSRREEKLICRDYKSNVKNSLPVLAKKYKYSQTTIYNVLRRNKVSIRSIKESVQHLKGRRVSDKALLKRVKSKINAYKLHFDDLDIDSDFGNYLAGFTDGEGTFIIVPDFRNRENYKTAFSISLRADDRKILEEFKRVLKVGHIRVTNRSSKNKRKWHILNGNPKVIWEVANYCDLYFIIIPFFEKFPLRAKKRRDFEIWSKAVKTRCECNDYSKIIDSLRNANIELKEIRIYREENEYGTK